MKSKSTAPAVAACIAVLLQAIGAVASAADEPAICEKFKSDVDVRPRLYERPPTRYPEEQVNILGEGWVQLGHQVTLTGEVQGIWLIDMIGAPIFARTAASSMTHARFRPGVGRFKVAPSYGEFEFEYRAWDDVTGTGVHPRVRKDLSWAREASERGDHRGAANILSRTLKEPLSLYEYSTVSHGLAMAYLGLGQRRPALAHIRHAAMAEGLYTDPSQRESIFALLAELAIRDNNLREGLCAFERLKRKRSDFQPSAELQVLLTKAEAELAATTPVRSEVELIESGRPDVPTLWRHDVLRPTLRFDAEQGKLTSYRLVCPLAMVDGNFPAAQPVAADQSAGPCKLYVFGDPGARFVLDER